MTKHDGMSIPDLCQRLAEACAKYERLRRESQR